MEVTHRHISGVNSRGEKKRDFLMSNVRRSVSEVKKHKEGAHTECVLSPCSLLWASHGGQAACPALQCISSQAAHGVCNEHLSLHGNKTKLVSGEE